MMTDFVIKVIEDVPTVVTVIEEAHTVVAVIEGAPAVVAVIEGAPAVVTVIEDAPALVITVALGEMGPPGGIGPIGPASVPVTLTAPADLDFLSYDGLTSQFVNHQLTTARVANIDESALADGAMLLYDGASSKYKATNTLNNPNTFLLGGTF